MSSENENTGRAGAHLAANHVRSTAIAERLASREQTIGAVERIAVAFERSAKRFEMIAYPAMLIFTLLGLYGFYQIYAVSRDMRVIAEQLQPQIGDHMTRLTATMEALTANISQISRNIDSMQTRMDTMSQDTRVIAKEMRHLEVMDQQLVEMNRSVQTMTAHTDMMRWNMANMNRSIARPMNFMNGFIPW
ncbi:MAG: hypothetical protein KDJ37_14090 [Hyphomicrobiaceae bacterium]|nr:hypothetical protein [Hyphomicrobiaceae bacterium]